MTTFVLATHNAHKVEELRRILGERLGPHELIGFDGPEPVRQRPELPDGGVFRNRKDVIIDERRPDCSRIDQRQNRR